MLISSLYTSYEEYSREPGDVAATSQGLNDDIASESKDGVNHDVIERKREGVGDDTLAKKGREGPDFLARWHFRLIFGISEISRFSSACLLFSFDTKTEKLGVKSRFQNPKSIWWEHISYQFRYYIAIFDNI